MSSESVTTGKGSGQLQFAYWVPNVSGDSSSVRSSSGPTGVSTTT